MKNLKKDLQDVNKALNALTKKVEKMIAAAGKPEKTVAKAKPAKKAISKPPKKPVTKTEKKAIAKKVAGKSATAKKESKITAPEIIMGVIESSEQGVDLGTIKEKTGFQGQKLYSTLSKMKKQGKITNPSKGIYVKA
ncbi:hypothetical protein ACFLZM_02295 [Thermodesulfobacteriota bacterium]